MLVFVRKMLEFTNFNLTFIFQLLVKVHNMLVFKLKKVHKKLEKVHKMLAKKC